VLSFYAIAAIKILGARYEARLWLTGLKAGVSREIRHSRFVTFIPALTCPAKIKERSGKCGVLATTDNNVPTFSGPFTQNSLH